MQPKKRTIFPLTLVLDLRHFFPRKIKNRTFNHQFLVSVEEQRKCDHHILSAQFGGHEFNTKEDYHES